jgi:predicted acyltransferase
MDTSRTNSTPSSNVATEEAVQTTQTSAATGKTAAASSQRNLALDAYRGLIMILLVSDGLGFAALRNHPVYGVIANQFEHRPWGGALFYDLIMPAFLFMVGVAMPFALARRSEQGATPRDKLRHVVVRCVHLIVISEILVSIGEQRAHLEVHNVLFVVAITYFTCYLLMRLDWWKQAVVAAVLLVSHSAIYLLFPGPNGAFAEVTNAGARLDRWLNLAQCNLPWPCVTINLMCEVPSVLFGVWVGNLLRSGKPRAEQMKVMTLGMIAAFVLGLIFSPLVPINKWLWTATYALYTTGWSILGLLIFYALIDVFGIRRPMLLLTVVGMNSLFVYCLGGLLGGWINNSIMVFTGGFKFIGTLAPVAQSCAVLLVIWYLTYWLYKRKIFLRA